MGVAIDIKKNGVTDMSLTDYSIDDFDLIGDTEVELNLKHGNITRSIVLTGVINPDTVSQTPKPKMGENGEQLVDEQGNPVFELREVDSVRQIANWAVIPGYCDCYKDMSIKITDARGTIVKQESFTDLYVVDYVENFGDESGAGKFKVILREREISFNDLTKAASPSPVGTETNIGMQP